MIRRNAYKVDEEGERTLVLEEILNPDGQVIAFKDKQEVFQTEGINDYDQEGRIIMEREVVDGVDSARTEYVYDDKGNIINKKQFVADTLFEQEVYEYKESGLIRRTFRYDEEIERLAEKKDGDKFVREFIENGVLIEKHVGKFDASNYLEKTDIYDSKDQLLATREQQFDEDHNLIKYQERDANGNLVVYTGFEYKNSNLVFEQHEDYSNNQFHKISYEYDKHGNLICKEIRTHSDKLVEHQRFSYDAMNRLTKESGYTMGSFNAIHGIYVNNDKYFLEYEYAELKSD